jgi:hypothetical protein
MSFRVFGFSGIGKRLERSLLKKTRKKALSQPSFWFPIFLSIDHRSIQFEHFDYIFVNISKL